MKNIFIQSTMVLAFSSIAAFSTVALCDDAKNTPSADDQKVMTQLHGIDLTEIAAGKLALSNSQNADVRSYGQHLIDDHKKADEKVMSFAAGQNVNLAAGSKTAEAKKNATEDQKTLNELKKLNGPDFDKAFLTGMAKGHMKAIALAQKTHDQTADQGFKDLLAGLIPELHHHYDMAASLEKKYVVGQ